MDRAKSVEIATAISCTHWDIQWPTTFCLFSVEPPRMSKIWAVLVQYCSGKPGHCERGPTYICYETFKRFFCVKLFGSRHPDDVYQPLQQLYLTEPSFGYEFLKKNEEWIRDLTTEGVEPNPGPAFSKCMHSCDLRRVPRFVESQGFLSDYFSIPANISKFSQDFHNFVGKIPDQAYVQDAFQTVQGQIQHITNLLTETASQINQALVSSGSALMMIRKLVVGALSIIIFISLAKQLGLTNALVTIVLSFLFYHFGFLKYFVDFSLDNGGTMIDYFRRNFISNPVVELQSFGHPLADVLVNADNIGAILAALFTALFIGSVHCNPTTRDYEDFSRKIFNYTRGATAMSMSFDKLKEFWTWTVNRICERMKWNMDSTTVSVYTISAEINDWLASNTALFKEGYNHHSSMEQRAQYVERIRSQYNRGLDLINLIDRLDRAKGVVVRFWVDKLHKKIDELSTESLSSTVRNPPTTILLYGPSGVGKSSLITGLSSFCAKVHAVLSGVDQPAVGSVYVRNCDQAHYDGYTNQHTLVIDDFLSRKDTDSNPNPEAGELIKIKNNVPFPLPMAHLPEKGRVFNSQVVILTTNCRNITTSLGSMNFPYATANRLTDASYACYVLPPYRKYISQEERNHLQSICLHDQHSVDPIRAQYNIRPNASVKPIPLGERHLLDTYTDEQFESIKGEKRLLPNGQVQYMNYGIYYFQKLDVKTGDVIGDPLSWKDFLNEVESVYARRMTIGENMLQQTKWFHTTSLAGMKEGVIDVPSQGYDQLDDNVDDYQDVDNTDEPLDFALSFAARNFEDLYDASKPSMVRLLDGYLTKWPNFGELLQAYMDRDLELEKTMSRWDLMWSSLVKRYENITAGVERSEIVQLLKWGTFVVGIVSISGCFLHYAKKFCKSALPTSVAVPTAVGLGQWFNQVVDKIHVSRSGKAMSKEEVLNLFQQCGYGTVESQAAGFSSSSTGNTVRAGKCKVFVPSHGFDSLGVSQLAADSGGDVENSESGLYVTLPCLSTPTFIVQLQSCQLMDQNIDYIISQNSFILRVKSAKRNKFYDFGNIFFLDDRKFLMPYHYMLMLQYQLNHGNISRDDMVLFSRGPTVLERRKDNPPNRISCRVQDVLNYARVISRAYLDDPDLFEKDAVVVSVRNMTGYSCASMVKKFITRDEFAKINDSGLSGYLVGQRFCGGNTDCYSIAIPCCNITPVNRFRRTGLFSMRDVDHDDLVGVANAGPANNPTYFQSVIRDRYNYRADTRQGDCGMVLMIDSPHLQHHLVGIHVAGDREAGKGNSVPITQEDLRDAISRLGVCDSECFNQPELINFTPESVDAIFPLVPKGHFQYLGLLKGKHPLQPLRTTIKPSVAQIHLSTLKNLFFRKCGYQMDISIRKAPAQLRIFFRNPEGFELFYGKRGELMFRQDTIVQSFTDQLFEEWQMKGGIVEDVLMKGLAKTSQLLPFLDPDLIDKAILGAKQNFLRPGASSQCPFEKAVSQNYSDSPSTTEVMQSEIVRYHAMLEVLQSSIDSMASPRDAYRHLLRTLSVGCAEGVVIRSYLDEEPKKFLQLVAVGLGRAMRDKCINDKTLVNPMILTLEQAVMGIPGDPTIKPINSKKSPGYPYSTLGLNYGKKPWVGKECKCDGELWSDLVSDVTKLIAEAQEGIPAIYFVATLKDELRPIAKVQACKTRVFCAAPMHFSIAFRMYFLRFLSFVQENRLFNESAFGVNYYSREWEELADKLGQWGGDTCFAGDFENFDGTLNNQILEKILDIVQSFYDTYGATEQERTIRRNLWRCVTRSMVICRKGGVIRLFNSQPSGNPFTTIINILFNSVVFRMAYMELVCERTDLKRTVFDFEDDVKLVSFGDDNIIAVNPQVVHIFNMQTVSQHFRKYGLVYTDENKSANFPKVRPLRELNFLKRGFSFLKQPIGGRRCVAPLDIDTVKEICLWVRKGDENCRRRVLADGLKTTLVEMSLHGQQIYEEWCAFAEGFSNSNLLGEAMIPIPDYYTQFLQTCDLDLDPDHSSFLF